MPRIGSPSSLKTRSPRKRSTTRVGPLSCSAALRGAWNRSRPRWAKPKSSATLRPFLGDEGARASLSYGEAALALNVGMPALKTLIHRLRRRNAQLLREEVAQTVLNPDDVDAEVHALCEALVQAKGRVQV
jgi:hypothetical protein